MRRLSILLALIAAPAAATPPATVAVAFDRSSMHTVLAEGLADKAAGRAVTANDPVRIASVSKLVTALGVLRMVDAGQLDLDRDVSDYLGWRLLNPHFPDQPITLRLLLSHQASLTDGGELYIIPLDTTLRERLADPRLWDAAHPPGSGWFAYANINFPVAASVMERVSGERFDRLMHRLVLRPLRLDACFNWGAGCSPKAVARATVLYRANGEVARDDLNGQLPACPVVVREGQPCNLARIGQMLARGGRGFLSPASIAALTEPQWSAATGTGGIGEYGQSTGFFCRYGLGLQRIGAGGTACRDDLFGDGRQRIGHSGEAYGLRSGLWVDPDTGEGLAFFTTQVPDDEPQGRSAFTAREEAVVERARR